MDSSKKKNIILFGKMDSSILRKEKSNRLMLLRKIGSSLYYENYISRPTVKYTKIVHSN